MNTSNNSQEYFASLPGDDPEYLDQLVNLIDQYREFCSDLGKYSKWQRALNNYYGISSDGLKSSNVITQGGDSSQLSMMKVADYRNLIQHQLILITGQRPAGQAKAINSDPVSLHQARIGSLLTEYYMSQIGWEAKFVKACEASLVCDESFFVLDWDTSIGDPIRPDENGRILKTGDATLRTVMPWQMARDPYIQDPADMKWGIYTYRVNKWDLAAKFPAHKEVILKNASDVSRPFPFNDFSEVDTDQIAVHVLSHDQSDACPNGRVTIFIQEQVLLDVPTLPFSEWNIYRMSQNDILDTGFGYSNNNDLLALEAVTDSLYSTIITNELTFGCQSILAAKGSGLDHTQLANGGNFFEVEPAMFEKIKPLQMTATAPEIFKFIETLSRKKETLAGINSVVRGDPEGALRSNSGSALALVQAQSLQFQSGGQRSYYHALSKVNTGLIKLLQRYAANERIVRITGKVQGQYLKEFKYTGDDLSKISSVIFEMVDPVFQSIGGKISIADNLLNKGMITNARQYLTVVRTGSLDAFTEGDEGSEIAIKSENERLREGIPVQVIASENHEEHIAEHSQVIATPEAKENMQLVQAATAHIQEHVNMWNELSMNNPALLIATKQKVLPPPPPPVAAPVNNPENPTGIVNGASGAGMGANPPPDQHANADGAHAPQVLGNQSPVETKAATVEKPRMPINPATGQRAQVPGVPT